MVQALDDILLEVRHTLDRPEVERWAADRWAYWARRAVTDRPYVVRMLGKVVSMHRTRGEAIEEALWAVMGEDHLFTTQDEQAAYLDLLEGREVLGWSVSCASL